MPTVTQALRQFLKSQQSQHPGRDLLERYLAFDGMETQVNAAKDDGEPVEGRKHTWSDGNSTWFSIRVPKNANGTPEWEDYELRWAPEEHAEGIGSTGWDWKHLRSRWVGFDIDDITSHAPGVGVTDEEMARVREAVRSLDYVEVRLSTSGRGLHLYVLFDDEGVPTANHTEHAALARCILGMMTASVGFDFATAIDACGSNMWLWHRKTTPENQGLSLVKAATKRLAVADLPSNWRDHISVVTRQSTKIRLQGVASGTSTPFDDLTSARRIIPLDDRHKLAIEMLMETGYSTVWLTDHHLLQTHTRALAKLSEDAQSRSKLGFIGHFQTNSPGRNPGEPNCFLFPTANGGWRVYRFSQGIQEAETWVQDGAGWTTCYFNRLPDLDTACRSYGGQAVEGKPHYLFPDTESAIKASQALGQALTVPAELSGRSIELRVNNGYLTTYIKKIKEDPDHVQGWINKKGAWIRDSKTRLTPDDKTDIGDIESDRVLRSLNGPAGELVGWSYMSSQGEWIGTTTSSIKLILQGLGHDKTEAEIQMGKCAINPWRIICQPFADEFPGGRRWNRGAPQLMYAPAPDDGEPPQHPHWDLILNHVGAELTPALRISPWAQKYGITTGAQYLLLWIACCFREPFSPTPFLFLHGNENCGKSIFYESLALLVTKGVVGANKALTTTGDFNGELAGAVFCYIEEIDLSHHKVALPRIKDYVTAQMLSIRQMRTDTYQVPNTTHWIHVANSLSYCPIFQGDSRITAIEVPDLMKEQEIAKDILKEQLKQESPQFLRTIFSLSIPPAHGRLRLPIIETTSKQSAIETNKSSLDTFWETQCVETPGQSILMSVFAERFRQWLPDDAARTEWTADKIAEGLSRYTKSRRGRMIENISLRTKDE